MDTPTAPVQTVPAAAPDMTVPPVTSVDAPAPAAPPARKHIAYSTEARIVKVKEDNSYYGLNGEPVAPGIYRCVTTNRFEFVRALRDEEIS